MNPDINYGHLLATEIKKKGYAKKAICELLHIAYETLMLRLDDGEFTISQVQKLIANRYLPEN